MNQIALAAPWRLCVFALNLLRRPFPDRSQVQLKVPGSKFEVQGSKFEVQGSRFEVQGSRFKVQGSRFKIERILERKL
jgi:hypothetical protein